MVSYKDSRNNMVSDPPDDSRQLPRYISLTVFNPACQSWTQCLPAVEGIGLLFRMDKLFFCVLNGRTPISNTPLATSFLLKFPPLKSGDICFPKVGLLASCCRHHSEYNFKYKLLHQIKLAHTKAFTRSLWLVAMRPSLRYTN